ncbi:hypothetical protein [uncultured Methylobacterium sp.]|uniref:hypothetical protein n=1 Tax=uncultured Methylobacterium sp. TaxID=157278 RepID=UPI0035CBF598
MQSIPFAVLVVATSAENRDIFVVVYTAALGLILSVTMLVDGQSLFSPALGLGIGGHR